MAMKKIIITLMLGLLVSCGPSREQLEKDINIIKTQYNTSAVTDDELLEYVVNKSCGCNDDQTKAIEAKFKPLNEIVETQVETTTPVPTIYSKFSSIETGLPTGTVVKLDCSGLGTDNQNASDNYVTIRDYNGISKITRDVDVDLFLNLHQGDIIE